MKKFLENFWYYHKWKLFVALMVLMEIINTVSAFTSVEPIDHTIGLVTMQELPENLCQELSDAFSKRLADINEDGQVLVQVNVYHYGVGQEITPTTLTEDDAVHLAADLRVRESCLFLTDELEVFQEAGLVYGGECGEFPLFAEVPGIPEEFVIYFPAPVDTGLMAVIQNP